VPPIVTFRVPWVLFLSSRAAAGRDVTALVRPGSHSLAWLGLSALVWRIPIATFPSPVSSLQLSRCVLPSLLALSSAFWSPPFPLTVTIFVWIDVFFFPLWSRLSRMFTVSLLLVIFADGSSSPGPSVVGQPVVRFGVLDLFSFFCGVSLSLHS